MWAARTAGHVRAPARMLQPGVVTGLPCPESQQVSRAPALVDEELYARLMEPRRVEWRRRAAEPKQRETKVRYALRRADALTRPYGRRLDRCSTRGTRVKCGCKGWRGVRAHTCRQHLMCAVCMQTRARRLGMRIRAGLEAAMAGRPDTDRLVLMTLTLRHSGDVAADREHLAAGWRRFYKALHRRGWGRFAYVGVWEVTPGADGLGHVHMHVAAVWPWRDWSVCRQLWLDACPESERISFVAARRDGKRSDPKSVSRYLGKYLSKGMQTGDFTPALRAGMLAASYNTRWVFTSRRFWLTFTPCCQRCGERVIAAQYRWHGAPLQPPVERGPPQLELGLDERQWHHA